MHWKRFAHAFLLGTGVCVLGAGCAAFNALVSSPAGSGAEKNSPERMAAIGRVFENQGRYAQAQAMYRRTLKSQPGNTFVRQRLQYIASRNSNRSFDGMNRKTAEAMAAADRVPTQKKQLRQRPPLDNDSVRPKTQPNVIAATKTSTAKTSAAKTSAADPRSDQPPVTLVATDKSKADAEEPSSSSADDADDIGAADAQDLVFADAPAPEPGSASDIDESAIALPLLPVVEEESEEEEALTADSDEASSEPVESGIEQAALSDESEAQPAALVFAPGRVSGQNHVTPVAFEGLRPDNSGWKSTERQVTLTQILPWLDNPTDFEAELVTALRHGEDEGVKSLAASALAGCSRESTEDELRAASQNESALVRVTAVESLMSRGNLRENDVETLLTLMAGEDADIRAHAAGCLRYLSGGDRAAQCVEGLAGLLQDPDPSVVAAAVTTLGDFGASATAHRTSLIRLQAESNDEFVAEAADLALQRIPPEDSDQELSEPLSGAEQSDAAATLLPVVE